MSTIASKSTIQSLIILIILTFAAIGIVDHLQVPPEIKTEKITLQNFSAEQAMVHVEIIARKPHPTGSIANAEVRDYLVETLINLGAEVEIQRKLQTYKGTPRPGQSRFSYVENVVARFKGTETDKAILLMSHYDSKPNTTGAGDNSSGVAANLEIIRAVKESGLPLKNTLMVLFSDAEELGLLGSEAFFTHHRWAEDVSLVLNLDSRGSRGPVYMYQTSKNSGALIDIMSEVVPTPIASSLVNAVFSKLSFASDLSNAFKHDISGMNFAFVDGLNNYHSATDTSKNLSLESLQHLGNFALPLVQHLGNIALPIKLEAEQHYFNPLGKVLINYSSWIDWLIALISVSLILFICIQDIKLKTYKLIELIRSIGFAFVFVMITIMFILLFDRLVDNYISIQETLARQKQWFYFWALLSIGASTWLYGTVIYGFSIKHILLITLILTVLGLLGGVNYTLLIIGVVLGILLLLIMYKPMNSEVIYKGLLIFLLLLEFAVLYQLAGAAYILTWSLLPIIIFESVQKTLPLGRILTSWIRFIIGIPALLLFSGTALLFDLLVGYIMPFISMLPILLVMMVFLPTMNSKRTANLGATLVIFALLISNLMVWKAPWSAEKPQPVSQFVLHDVNTNQSYWASFDETLTDWHRISLGNNPKVSTSKLFQPNNIKPIFITPINHTKILSPKLSIVEFNEQRRSVTFRVQPGHLGDSVSIWLKPDTKLLSWKVEGKLLALEKSKSKRWYSLSGFAIPAEGVEICMLLEQEEPWPKLHLISVHDGLIGGLSIPTRNEKQVRGSTDSHSDSTVTFEHIILSKLITKKRVSIVRE